VAGKADEAGLTAERTAGIVVEAESDVAGAMSCSSPGIANGDGDVGFVVLSDLADDVDLGAGIGVAGVAGPVGERSVAVRDAAGVASRQAGISGHNRKKWKTREMASARNRLRGKVAKVTVGKVTGLC
jgi:hypothetical protein